MKSYWYQQDIYENNWKRVVRDLLVKAYEEKQRNKNNIETNIKSLNLQKYQIDTIFALCAKGKDIYKIYKTLQEKYSCEEIESILRNKAYCADHGGDISTFLFSKCQTILNTRIR